MEFNDKQAKWLTHFLGNRLVAPKVVLENIRDGEPVEGKYINMALDDIERIRKFLKDLRGMM